MTFSSGGALSVVELTGSDPLPGKATEYLRDEFDAFLGRFSPDGHLIAFVSNETERNQLWVRPSGAGNGK